MVVKEADLDAVEAEAVVVEEDQQVSLEHVPRMTRDSLRMTTAALPRRTEIKTNNDSTNCSYPDKFHDITASAENTKYGCDLYKRVSHKA